MSKKGNFSNVLITYDLPCILKIKVIPNSKFEKIKNVIHLNRDTYYKVYVTALPEKGKANEAMIQLLSKTLGIAKSSFTITHGQASNVKTILVNY